MPPIDTVPGLKSKSRTVTDHAERILRMNPELHEVFEVTKDRVRKVIEIVFADDVIRTNFRGTEIRRTAMCGEVSREVLCTLGESPDQIGLMSIGDVDLPDFARVVADQMMESSHEHHRALVAEEGLGYDLTSQGSERARASMVEYFDQHYAFSAVDGLKEKLILNSTIIGGGMRGLDDIATAMVSAAERESTVENPRKHRFVYPDNSFRTWEAIVELRSSKGKTAEAHKISTDQNNHLHLTPDQVDKFYEAHPVNEGYDDSWCITPVGNPSGTCIEAEVLTETCKRIVNHNPRAIIILDCTYVRTLKSEVAKKLVEGVIGTPKVLDRVIFLESFSKTHGFSGERLGAYFSANAAIYANIQSINGLLSAGNGRQKSALVLALTSPTEEQESRLRELHEFWARERGGLYAYLITSGKFPHIFDEEQTHIEPDQLKNPLGLYVLLKLKPGVDGKQVLLETGCLGVETELGSGTYIRFSVGKLKTPTYAKYLTESSS